VAHLDLTGPIGFTESKTSALNNYLITGAGKIRIAMRRE